MKTIAFVNQKGGVGKTTLAVVLAYLWSEDYKVALIDFDIQGQVGQHFGLEPGYDLEGEGVEYNRRLHIYRSNNAGTAALREKLDNSIARETWLRRRLKELSYDYVLLDCAPSLDLLQLNALVASDYVVVPTRLDHLSLQSIRQTMVTMLDIYNHDLHVADLVAVVPNQYERKTTESQVHLNNLRSFFKHTLAPAIPLDTKVREASRAGMPLPKYSPNCRAMLGDVTQPKRIAGGFNALSTYLLEAMQNVK